MLEPFTQPLSCLFIAKNVIWDHGSSLKRSGAYPGELMLHPEVTGSPRRASSFSPKQYGGPSEPGFRKLSKKTLFPLLLGIFRIPDQNVE